MTREEYEQALHRCEVLMSVDPAPQSVYGRELLRIVVLVEQYERVHFPTMFSREQRHEVPGG